MKTNRPLQPTAEAPLLYWLALVCGARPRSPCDASTTSATK